MDLREYSSGRKQQGMAAVLLMLLIGLSLTATVMGIAAYIRGAQEQHLAMHTQTQSQLRAWTGVEVIVKYFTALSKDELSALAASSSQGTAITMSGVSDITARFAEAPTTLSSPERWQFAVAVTGTGAGATTTILAKFEVTPPTPPTPLPSGTLQGVIVRKNLTINSSFDTTNGAPGTVMAEGGITIKGGVTGVSRICAVKDASGNGGNIVYDRASGTAGVTVDYLCADGNIDIDRLVATTADVVGTTTLSGNSVVDTLNSNGDVVLLPGAYVKRVNSKGSLSLGAAATYSSTIKVDVARLEKNLTWRNRNSIGSIAVNGDVIYGGNTNNSTEIIAVGNVTLEDGDVNKVTTQGNTTLAGTTARGIRSLISGQGGIFWSNALSMVTAGTVGGAIQAGNANIKAVSQAGYTVSITPVTVPAVTVTPLPEVTVDVNTLKARANYLFEADASGRPMVTVKNVHGIADGSYYIGKYSNSQRDYLCTKLNADNVTCVEPALATAARQLCEPFSSTTTCFTYSGGLWTFNLKTTAPGVIWVGGNLKLANGVYMNTILASGNIDATTGSVYVHAINKAGYAAVCNNDRSAYSAEGATASPAQFAGIYPANYCNTGSGQMISTSVGNVALAAGGYSGATYVGGDIKLAGSTKIYGSVVAGNTLDTSGSTSISGRIVVAALGAGTTSNLSGGGKITVPTGDLSSAENKLPFDPGENSSAESTVKVWWTRYL